MGGTAGQNFATAVVGVCVGVVLGVCGVCAAVYGREHRETGGVVRAIVALVIGRTTAAKGVSIGVPVDLQGVIAWGQSAEQVHSGVILAPFLVAIAQIIGKGQSHSVETSRRVSGRIDSVLDVSTANVGTVVFVGFDFAAI